MEMSSQKICKINARLDYRPLARQVMGKNVAYSPVFTLLYTVKKNMRKSLGHIMIQPRSLKRCTHDIFRTMYNVVLDSF